MFKRTFGCGSLIAVFFVTVAIIVIGAYFAFTNFISPYLNNADIQEIYDIYVELSKDVNEESLVSNAPQEVDYDNAQQALVSSGIDIFNEYGDIDPTQIDESNFFPTNNITLADRELASLINAFIENPLNLQQVGINTEDIGGLQTKVLEVIIDEIDATTINLSFIVRLDMTQIKTQLGFFGFFLPDELYITNQNTLHYENNAYTLVSGNIHANNLPQETNDRMLEILVEALNENNPELTVESLNTGIGELILSGIEEVSNTFHTSITFAEGQITFIPDAQQ
jgi:hypothetical protein